MKFHQLEYLVAVADRGSVRAAAQTLDVSPAAVSRALIELEDQLSTTLFVRQSLGAVLTEAGRSLLVHAREILANISMAKDATRAGRLEAKTLLVGVTPWLAEAFLPTVLDRFCKLRPGVHVHLSETFGESQDALRDRSLDLVLGTPPQAEAGSEFSQVNLFKYELAVICREGHPLANVRSLGDLRNAAWIVERDVESYPSPMREVLREARDDVRATRIHYARSPKFAGAMVAGGELLTISPRPVIEMRALRDRVSVLDLVEPVGRSVVSVLTRRCADANIKAFVRVLIEVIDESSKSFDPEMKRLFEAVEYAGLPASHCIDPNGDGLLEQIRRPELSKPLAARAGSKKVLQHRLIGRPAGRPLVDEARAA